MNTGLLELSLVFGVVLALAIYDLRKTRQPTGREHRDKTDEG